MTLGTATQLRAARAILNWKQSELAARSGVSLPSVKRLESLDGKLGAHDATIDKLQRALELAGVEFTNGDAPGVRNVRSKRDFILARRFVALKLNFDMYIAERLMHLNQRFSEIEESKDTTAQESRSAIEGELQALEDFQKRIEEDFDGFDEMFPEGR